MAFIDLIKRYNVGAYYKRHKEEIMRYVASEHLSRPDFASLKYEFTSESGKKWYSIPEQMALPFDRFLKNQTYFQWLTNGISPDEFDRIRDELMTCFAHIKAKTKESDKMIVQAGLLIEEMNRRRQQALPYYVLINIVANVMVREDEDYTKPVSGQIHREKCDEIEREIEIGNNAFFLTLPQLRKLSEIQNMSIAELTSFLKTCEIKAQEDLNRMKAYISWKDAERGKPTS
jgi:hypothetical protein